MSRRKEKRGGSRSSRKKAGASARSRKAASEASRHASRRSEGRRDPARAGFGHEGFHHGGKRIPEGLYSYITGIVDMKSSGKAYILPDNKEIEDVYIGPNSIGHALHGDHVRVQLFPARAGRRMEGQIVEVLKRNKKNVVGTVDFSGRYAFLIPDSTNMINIFLPRENLNGVRSGQKAVVRITDWPPYMNNPIGEVTHILGRPGENDVEMQSILAEFDFPLSYPKEAEAEASRMKAAVTAKELARRRDFRPVYTCTIDPSDAKDFDDALSFRRLPNGHAELGVHIADVSHFVKEGGAIEQEAYARATSVYLVDRTIPMLPEKLCNDLCSLKPDVDRFTFSVLFEMDDKAQIKHFWIGKGIIHSDRRFTYEQAQEIIEAAGLAQGSEADARRLSAAGSAQDIEAITGLFKLSAILRGRRFRTGSINFKSQEVRFRLDPETAKPVGVYIKESKESNHLVEEFMLLANKRVAELIGKDMKVKPLQNGVYGSESTNRVGSFDKEKSLMPDSDLCRDEAWAENEEEAQEGPRGEGAPHRGGKQGKRKTKPKTFVYRIHDEPNPEKLQVFSQFVAKLGYKMNLESRGSLVKSFNGLLTAVEGKAEQNMIETIAIRTMAKARYSTRNIGHYGLAFPYYTHFTSPIRRYPDLMVHRLLERYIHGGASVPEEDFEEKCEHSSEMEKRAADAERTSVKYKQAEYLAERVGEEFPGAISGVSKWGIYVCLDGNYCEGMVPLRSLTDDYYELDEDNYQVVGLHSGQVYKLGQKVRIRVQEIDMNKKQLTFVFADQAGAWREKEVDGLRKGSRPGRGKEPAQRRGRRERPDWEESWRQARSSARGSASDVEKRAERRSRRQEAKEKKQKKRR